MQKLIIDTDPGIDDAHAILLATAYPGVQVLAITTVAGNVSLDKVTRNAGIILDVIGQEVPIYAGCPNALVIPTPRRALSHGPDGLGESGYPDPTHRPEAEHAALALIRLANLYPGEIILAAIGPLTNLALAVRLDPTLPGKLKRTVVMGGAVEARGNSWERTSEFNFYCDPEAAAVVFQAWSGLTLVPWETCLAHGLRPDQVEQLAKGTSARAELFRRTIQKRFVEQAPGKQVLSVPDPLALAVALEPEIVRRVEPQFIEVELSGQMTRGQTVVDYANLLNHPPNASIVWEIDRERFFELMIKGLE